jgi:fibro-slime domain-containing protein
MVISKATWLAGATAVLTLASGVGCSAGADLEDEGIGPSSGGSNSGGYSSLGGQFSTGGSVLLTGGSGSDALPEGVVRGHLRDFNAGFPDYRPRLDTVMGVDGLVDQSVGADYTKDQNTHDLEIVGPLGSPLGADGKPVYMGNPYDGTVTTWGSVHPLCEGEPCFTYWFRDDPRFNQTIEFDIQLLEDPAEPGTFVFDNGGQMWFPIDGQMYGNDDPDHPEHNYGFTYELAIEFRYVPGQEFTFIGDDDVFVYINNALAVNLGGIHGRLEGSVNLDDLGLVPDNNYMLHFFFAERNPTFSNFRIETSIAPDDWVIY